MRILLVADLHYTLPQLDWMVEAGPAFDVVVVAGDLLDFASTVPLDAQAVVVLHYLALLDASTTLIVASGNHDLTGPDGAGEQAPLWLAEAQAAGIHTDGDSVLLGDTLVTVCPWWDGPVGRGEVARLLACDAVRRPERWVWVYHWPPQGSPTCWTGRKDYGDPDLGSWIDEYGPDIVLSGHVHQAAFTGSGSWADRIDDTWVFNAGRQIGRVPARVELDFDVDRARWVSIMGEQTCYLTDLGPPSHPIV